MKNESRKGQLLNKRNRTFLRQLVFERSTDPEIFGKVAEFTDRDGNKAQVVTTWNRIIPGFRYICKLETPGSESEDGYMMYNMTYCRMWVDDIQVKTEDDTVFVTLDDKPVPELTFGEGIILDVDFCVRELRNYFRVRKFQLANRDDIDKFISVYRVQCQKVYAAISARVTKSRDYVLTGDKIRI